MRTITSIRAFVVAAGVAGVVLLGLYDWLISHTVEFRMRAHLGQPIVRAVEQFRKETGSYPASLVSLAPKYLPTVPDMPDQSKHKFDGWDYRLVTNGVAISYGLSYYMGKAQLQYEPPTWVGEIDGGHKTIIFRNE
jgi:hypothetical protein